MKGKLKAHPVTHSLTISRVFFVSSVSYTVVVDEQTLSVPERFMFSHVIEAEYLSHMTVNHLPAAYEVRVVEDDLLIFSVVYTYI